MEKQVLIIQCRMTEYRVPLFEKLWNRLNNENISLQVVYGTPTNEESLRNDEGILGWGIKVPCRYMSVNGIQFIWQKVPRAILRKQNLIIVPHENRLLHNYILLLSRHFSQRKLAFWGHGANFQIDNNNCVRDKLKSWTARQGDWWFAYTSLSKQKIIEKGFNEDRITCLNNSVDTKSLMHWRRSIQQDEINDLRTSIGLRGSQAGIFLGGLYKNKRLRFLFSAADRIKQKLPGFELIMIGDGAERDKVQDFVRRRNWAYWLGTKHGREKVLYLSLGRIMLNPGLVGLGILDSFAMGLPLITTDCGIHSPEIAYLDSGRNGLMVENQEDTFVSEVVRLLADDASHEKMASACTEDAERYSLEKMVDNFSAGILQALDLPQK